MKMIAPTARKKIFSCKLFRHLVDILILRQKFYRGVIFYCSISKFSPHDAKIFSVVMGELFQKIKEAREKNTTLAFLKKFFRRGAQRFWAKNFFGAVGRSEKFFQNRVHGHFE